MSIPKIVHQLWIGPNPRPSKFMQTWKDKHPDFEYIIWNEEELQKRQLPLQCGHRINEIEEINGKADIIRWEILFHYGGLFVDADSICIEPFDKLVENPKRVGIPVLAITEPLNPWALSLLRIILIIPAVPSAS